MTDKHPNINHELLEIVSSEANGLTLGEIEAEAQHLELSRSTLRRRLAEHVEIEMVGERGGARYVVKVGSGYTHLSQSVLGDIIPLSKKGRQLLSYLRRPVSKREQVPYKPDFLAAYVPNETPYLTDSEIKALMKLGEAENPENFQAQTYVQSILEALMIDLSYHSSRLEGNTYSLIDTQNLIRTGQAAEGKNAADAQMILNHKAAIEFLAAAPNDETLGFNRHTITNLHGLLSNNLLSTSKMEGRLRERAVGISHSAYTPLAIPQKMSECFDEILTKANAIQNPFEQAFFAMVHLPYLQPFEDVNKRTSRLSLNLPLLKHGLAPLSFVQVPERAYIYGTLGVYERNDTALLRDVFMWAYEQSARKYASVRQTVGEPDTFRLKHQNAMYATISAIIRQGIPLGDAPAFIQAQAEAIPQNDRKAFVLKVEEDLLALHNGNYAKYHITPKEWQDWKNLT